jgi:hypothetical protein
VRRFSEAEKALIWDRRSQGVAMGWVARELGRAHGSVRTCRRAHTSACLTCVRRGPTGSAEMAQNHWSLRPTAPNPGRPRIGLSPRGVFL